MAWRHALLIADSSSSPRWPRPTINHGQTLLISNDSDFGIAGVTNTAPPWQLEPRLSPTTGAQDDGEYPAINLNRLPAVTSAATVSITVT